MKLPRYSSLELYLVLDLLEARIGLTPGRAEVGGSSAAWHVNAGLELFLFPIEALQHPLNASTVGAVPFKVSDGSAGALFGF